MRRLLRAPFGALGCAPLHPMAPLSRAQSGNAAGAAPPKGKSVSQAVDLGGASTPAAPGGGKKKKKGAEKESFLPSRTDTTGQRYAQGDKDRPFRGGVRAEERAARGAALAAARGGAPPTGEPTRDDPVLSALLEAAGGGAPGERDFDAVARELRGVEEPADVRVLEATRRFSRIPNWPEELKEKIIVYPHDEEEEMETEVEDDDPREELRAARAVDAAVAARKGAALFPFFPAELARGGAAERAEREDATARLVEKLLKADPNLERARRNTAEAARGGGGGSGGDSDGEEEAPYSLLRDRFGNLATPEAAAGLADPRLGALASRALTGHPLSSQREDFDLESTAYYNKDDMDKDVSLRLQGPMGDDPRLIPRGVLEEFASPLLFKDHEREPPEPPPRDSSVEATMTAEERAINARRLELRKVIEEPVPIATRPLWPLYAHIVGADIVRGVTNAGRTDSMRTMIVVGNGHGGVGLGMAKHKDAAASAREALNKAIRDMIHVDTHLGSLHHDLIGKKNNVFVLLRAMPATGNVLKGAPYVLDVLELAGITRASAKIFGSHRRLPYIVMQALFDAFNYHESPEQHAVKRGLRLVRQTADRVNPATTYPSLPRGPRFPQANRRFNRTGTT
jgi:small subunit ribosomal protein S5